MGDRVKFTVPGEASIETALFVEGEEVDTASPELGQSLVYDASKFTPDYPSAYLPSNEPMGFENRTDSQISFTNLTRTFTISPTSTSFTIWHKGRPYEKTATETVTIPNTSGLYYIEYTDNGALTYQTSFFNLQEVAPVAYISWNATLSTAVYFADERHGTVMDWQTHEYLHRTRGAAFASGFFASGYTLNGSGSSNAHAHIDISNGTFFDEDIKVQVTHSNTPTANTWEQDLQGPARIPIFYRSGSAWVKDTATDYPLKNQYTGSSLAEYNLNSGGTWSSQPLGNNKYGVTWIAATNNLNEPVVGVLGQAEYGNSGAATDATWDDLDLSGFPSVEFRPLWKVTYQTATGYTNEPKSRFIAVDDIRGLDAILGVGAVSGGGGTSAPVAAIFNVPGTVTVGVGASRFYATRDLTIGNVVASVGTAPTGSTIIVDVKLDGSTVFTTTANRPTIAIGANVDLDSVPDIVGVTAGQYLTVDVIQRGSTIPGSDLVVQVLFI